MNLLTKEPEDKTQAATPKSTLPGAPSPSLLASLTNSIAQSPPGKLAKNLLTIDTSSPYNAGTSAAQAITDSGIVPATKDFVANSPLMLPARHMTDVVTLGIPKAIDRASKVWQFAGGLFDGNSPEAEAPANPAAKQPAAPATPPPVTPARPEMNWSRPADEERYNLLGLQEMLRSPGPSTTRHLVRDDNGKHLIRETINGSDSPPALTKPYLSPSAFSRVTGYMQDQPLRGVNGKVYGYTAGTPIYGSGAAEMAAANAGIADYNNALLSGYDKRNELWAAQQGVTGAGTKQGGDSKLLMEMAKNSHEMATNMLKSIDSMESDELRQMGSDLAAQQVEQSNRLLQQALRRGYGGQQDQEDLALANPAQGMAELETISQAQKQIRVDLGKNSKRAYKKYSDYFLDSSDPLKEKLFQSLQGEEYQDLVDYVRNEGAKRKERKKAKKGEE